MASNPQSDQIVAIVASTLGNRRWLKPKPDVTVDSLLVDDLDCDAIDIATIACAVEEALHIDISDAAAESWASVADIVASVNALREAA